MSTRYIGGLVYNPPGGWSGLFNGTTSNLSLPYSANYVPGTGDFTVECWVNFSDISTTVRRFFGLGYGANGSGPVTTTWQLVYLGSEGSNQIRFYRYDGSTETFYTTSGFNPVNGQWYHVAVSRTGGNLYIFVNGVALYSAANSFNFSAVTTSDPFLVGLGYYGPQSGMNGPRYFPGYISNIRFIKGTGIYSANFTPPTGRLAAITNTQLLLCQSPTFVDNSSNAATVTNNSATVSTANPFPTSVLPNPALGNAGNGIYTLSQYASLLGAGTWPAYDPYYENVTLNLHGNAGAVLPFNTDASTNNFQVTQVGDTRPSNLTPFITNGYWSNFFDGSGDSLTFTANSSLSFTGDLTVEGWVYLRSYAGSSYNECTFVSLRTGLTVGTQFDWGRTGGSLGAGTIEWWANGIICSGTAGDVPLNQWVHLAWVRSGSGTNNCKIYVNGVLKAQGTNTSTLGVSSGTCYIGSSMYDQPMDGYSSNVRITNTAVYTTAFTPPTTPLTAISGTSLLTCQSSRFIDNSTNSFTITANGNVAVNPLQPFTAPTGTSAYGSGYFDGSGDYLTVDQSAGALGTGDWTVEFWWQWTSATGDYQTVISKGIVGGTPANGSWSFGPYQQANNIWFAYYNSGFNDVSTSYNLNDGGWHHMAATRVGTALRLYADGVLRTSATLPSSFNFGASGSDATLLGYNSRNARYINGYVSNFNIIKGTALYTGSTYTVPTAPLSVVSGTALLTLQTNAPSQNNTFLDSSTNNFVITRSGNTTQGTFTPYGTNWSNFFNATTDKLTLTGPNLSGLTNFTFECWVNFNGFQSDAKYFLAVSGGSYYQLVHDTSAGISLRVTGYTSVVGQSSNSGWSVGTWYHVALVKSGTTYTIYRNGVSIATNTYGSALPSIGIGFLGGYDSTTGLNAYMSNTRITNTAVYTAAFTPSTGPLTAITGTLLLTSQSNRFVDNSASPYTLTVSGTPSVQRITPFNPTASYAPSVIGGSGYFDGSGDWLTAPSNAGFGFGTGDFTIEGWVYWTGGAGENTFFCVDVTSGANIFLSSGGNWGIGTRGVVINNNFGTPPTQNVWNHLAVSRSGSTIRAFINGAQVFSGSNSTNYATGSPAIAAIPTASGNLMSGYITDLRVVKGTAVYTAAFTPPTAPLTAITNTQLLTNFTNAAILDNAMTTDWETVGNTQLSTSVKKYGNASMYFDGSGDYLQMPLSRPVLFGTNNFTIEMWVNPSTTNHQSACLFTQEHIAASNTPISIAIFLNAGSFETVGNGISFGVYNGSWVVLQQNLATIPINTWTYITLVRNSTTFTMYVNGVSVGSATSSTSCSLGSTPFFIGRRWDTFGSYPYFNGYIDDFRVTNGVARYTANFTPPTSQVQDQ